LGFVLPNRPFMVGGGPAGVDEGPKDLPGGGPAGVVDGPFERRPGDVGGVEDGTLNIVALCCSNCNLVASCDGNGNSGRSFRELSSRRADTPHQCRETPEIYGEIGDMQALSWAQTQVNFATAPKPTRRDGSSLGASSSWPGLLPLSAVPGSTRTNMVEIDILSSLGLQFGQGCAPS